MAPAGDDLEHGSGNHAGFRRAPPDCFKHMMTSVWLRPVTVGLPPIRRGCRSRRVPGYRAVARSVAQSRSTLASPLGRPAVDAVCRRTARRPRTAPLLHPWRRGPLAALPCISVVTSTVDTELPAPAIDRIVHDPVILEFDVPSYRTNAAQNRRTEEESDRPE